MNSTLSTEHNTVQGWTDVIATLTQQQGEDAQRIQQLQTEKRALSLDAALGNEEARKKLQNLNATLTTLAFDADNLQVALTQAQEGKKKAEQAIRDTAEKQRLAELSELATEAIEKAADYTRYIRAAVIAGQEARLILREMTRTAKPGEQTNLNRLMDYAPYERAAEFLGLRDFIETRAYTGPKEHLVPLEDEFATLLGRWLPKPTEDRKE
jgi:chromosome segregation ATPase